MAEGVENRACGKRRAGRTLTAPPSKRPAGFSIGLLQLRALSYALHHFPERTPKRWELLAQLVERSTVHFDCLGPDLLLSTQHSGARFTAQPNQCRFATSLLLDGYPGLLEFMSSTESLERPLFAQPDRDPFKPLVLLPHVAKCCDLVVVVRNRPSFPLVYTTKGTLVAACFHSECRSPTCGKRYYLSYFTVPTLDGQTAQYYYDPTDCCQSYFQVTSQTIFEKALLMDMTHNIAVSRASFETRADVYNCNFGFTDATRLSSLTNFTRDHNSQWRLNEQRVEDGWFLWTLVNIYHQESPLPQTDFHTSRNCSNRRDIDSLAADAWEHLCSKSNPWIHHSCSKKGCAEGYASLDGLEKICRPMCALPKERAVAGRSRETRCLNVTQCCPNTPIMGGRHQKPSKFCTKHCHLEEDKRSELFTGKQVLPEHAMVSEREDVPLPDNDDDSLFTGCKKAKSVQRFHDRTAGILAVVRPCGIVVNFAEMFTCESPTQAYIFLYTTFGRCLADLGRLRYLGYDRTCDLHPFLESLTRKGSMGAQVLLDNVKMMVDLWHCQKHKETTCMPPDNPNCKYHPHLPQFAEICGVNTECAEQAFKWLGGKFKYNCRKMTRPRLCIYLWKVLDCHNRQVEAKVQHSNT